MTTPFFSKDPAIKWTKVLCPICGQPTGEASECYNDGPDLPEYKKKLVHKNLGALPIFSPSCVFRQNNLWECSVNYPVSSLLVSQIQDVAGVERCVATKKYTFQIVIGKTFEESEVKRLVNIVFKTFIKEMQSIEASRFSVEKNTQISGISFPNGILYLDESGKEGCSLLRILDRLEGVKEIDTQL